MHRHYTLDVSVPLLRTQGYVDGRWVSAASEFPVLDPATGREIARVSDCGPAEAKQAVDAAYRAFQSWKQCTAKVWLHARLNRTLLEKLSIFDENASNSLENANILLLGTFSQLSGSILQFGVSDSAHDKVSCRLSLLSSAARYLRIVH